MTRFGDVHQPAQVWREAGDHARARTDRPREANAS